MESRNIELVFQAILNQVPSSYPNFDEFSNEFKLILTDIQNQPAEVHYVYWTKFGKLIDKHYTSILNHITEIESTSSAQFSLQLISDIFSNNVNYIDYL